MKIKPFRHFWLKITALCLAVLIWWVISGEVTVVRTFSGVHLKILLSKGFVVTSGSIPRVSVTLSGPREAMERLTGEEISIRHSLAKHKDPATISFNLAGDDVTAPRRTQVVSVNPQRVTLNIDKIGEKNLPINVVFQGQPNAGYTVKEYSLNQSVVTINGPQKILDKLSVVNTKPIDLTKHDRTFLQEISLQPVYKDQKDLKKVQVLVKVEKESVRQTYTQVPVMILDSSEITRKSTLAPKQASVTLAGPKEIVYSIQPQEMKLYVDISGLRPGKYTLPINTLLPNAINAEAITPKEVEIEIKSELEDLAQPLMQEK